MSLNTLIETQAGFDFTGADCRGWMRDDVIIMGHILHDGGLEEKCQLIAKAHAALSKGGALIVCEAIIDDERWFIFLLKGCAFLYLLIHKIRLYLWCRSQLLWQILVEE